MVEQGGSDFLHKNYNGHSARDIALQKNKSQIVEYLEIWQGPEPQQPPPSFLPIKEPHDVFLINTGKGGEKANLAYPMKDFMERHGLSCFLDSAMKVSVDPNQTMQANLQCCRLVVSFFVAGAGAHASIWKNARLEEESFDLWQESSDGLAQKIYEEK